MSFEHFSHMGPIDFKVVLISMDLYLFTQKKSFWCRSAQTGNFHLEKQQKTGIFVLYGLSELLNFGSNNLDGLICTFSNI